MGRIVEQITQAFGIYSVEVVSDSGFFSSIRNYIAIIRNTDTGKSKEVHLGKSVKA